MFKRKDGKLIQCEDPAFRIIPLLMKERNDSEVFFGTDIPIEKIDTYLKEKQEKGIKLSYMHIIYSALIRTINEREKLNRFIMSGKLYQRNDIYITMTIKKSLSDDGDETNVKLKFRGDETPEKVKEILQKKIDEYKKENEENNQDKFVKAFSKTPHFVLKSLTNILMRMDKWNLMPKKIIDLSPFHASAYITNVGSIGLDAVYHHIYNFGTVGLFVAMGKKKKSYIFEDENLKEEKTISLSLVVDERICDGYYYATSLKLFQRYVQNPELLDRE